jgi:hypothetical protein
MLHELALAERCSCRCYVQIVVIVQYMNRMSRSLFVQVQDPELLERN